MPILLLFCSLTSKAQNISIGNNQDVTVSKTDYDDCGSIFELSLDISNDYYFAFQLMEDGKMISSSNLEFTGDAAVFTFDNDKNVIHQSSQYAGSTTLYLNTRNGYPYVLSSDAPSLTDYFIKTSGKTTLQEGDAINFTTVVCPASDNYTYQWYENGTAIASQTNADLTSYTPTVANAEYKLEIKESDVVVASKTIKVNTLGVQTRFTLDDWWGITSATSSCKELVGYCNSVYLITLSYTDNNPKFAIKENGIEIGTDKVSVGSGISISSITGDNNSTPGWSATGQLNGETVVYYLDARTTPYKLTKTLSSADFLVTHITQTQGEENIQRGGKVSFSSNICGSIATEDVTYQWYESANGGLDWTAIEGATAATLIDKEPTTDGTTYKVIATVGSLTSNSNEIKINFLPSSVIVNVAGANKINSVEYEAPNNQEITITAKAVEMTDVTYNILYKTFEGKEWRDTTISGGEDFWTFTPSENLEYQITATGVSSSSQEIETYKTNILIRIIYQCDADSTIDTLWYDDFGHFLNSTTYIVKDAEGVEQTYSGSITNPQGQVSSIINYFSADPNFFVQKHDFAGQDPLFGPYDNQLCEADGYKHYACWEGCDGYRVEDGYYSILPNPDLSNCGMPDKKYWSGSDHTGNENGGMLFVHCAENSEQTIIYEREVKIDCDNGLLLFSAFISNASIVEGDKPVNLRLEIYNENGNLVDVVSSGDIMPRNTGEKWSKMTRKFNANRGQYTIKLINNTSFETVVLLDDISVAICYPGISLITDLRDPSIKLIDTWDLKDAVNLYAYNENDIKSYIDNPKYIFQYKKEGGNWFNLTSISSTDFTSIALTKNDIRFHGTTKFRTIVASSKEIINRITDGEELSLNCEQIYAIDSSFIIKFHYGEIIEIATADDLVEFREAINGPTKQYKGITLTDGGKDKFFKLTADIDLSSVCSATKGSWIPIGTFKGSFDGSGHAISNLYINSPGSDNQGLFGDINSAIIKNVQLVGADVTANKNVGGVCGEGVDSEISQCTISGSVSGTEKVGGVCGDISSSIISNCSNSSKLSGTSSVGGVCGYTTGSSIIGKCINIGKVSGENSTGGVCGYYESSTITSCYYDKQMCPVTNGIGSPAESTNAEGKLTTEMTNGSLFNDAANWEEVAGMYPRPKGIEKTDAAIVTAMPVFLSKEENVNEVTADFAVGTGNSVVWSSTNNGGVVSFENGKATITKNGEVTFTAAKGAATKNVTLTLKKGMTIADISPVDAMYGDKLALTAPTVTDYGTTATGSWEIETGIGLNTFTDFASPYTVRYADNGKKLRYKATNEFGTVYSNEVTITVIQRTLYATTTIKAIKPYDGTATVEITDAGKLENVIDGDDVAFTATATYDDEKVGEDKTITVAYTISGADAGNYMAPADGKVSGSITSLVGTENLKIEEPQAICSGDLFDLKEPEIPFEKEVTEGHWEISGDGFATKETYTSQQLDFKYNGWKIRYAATTLFSGVQYSNEVLIRVNSPDLTARMWNDVIVCKNLEEDIVSYQWYRDGQAIAGATKQYYSDGTSLSGMYQVQVRTADGTEYGSCPAKYTKSAVKAGLKVYPNIARAHQSIKVELVGMDTDGAELMVYTLQGKKVEQQDISGGQATLYLPSGSYVVAAFTKEGQRLSEKLIVGN